MMRIAQRLSLRREANTELCSMNPHDFVNRRAPRVRAYIEHSRATPVSVAISTGNYRPVRGSFKVSRSRTAVLRGRLNSLFLDSQRAQRMGLQASRVAAAACT